MKPVPAADHRQVTQRLQTKERVGERLTLAQQVARDLQRCELLMASNGNRMRMITSGRN
jgi:hypothetical protein